MEELGNMVARCYTDVISMCITAVVDRCVARRNAFLWSVGSALGLGQLRVLSQRISVHTVIHFVHGSWSMYPLTASVVRITAEALVPSACRKQVRFLISDESLPADGVEQFQVPRSRRHRSTLGGRY